MSIDRRLVGERTAIVTGAATGIGRAIATRLAASGFRVVINYLKSEAEARSAASAVEGIGAECMVVQADVAEDADCSRLTEEVAGRWGRVDALSTMPGTRVPYQSRISTTLRTQIGIERSQ